MFDGILKIKLKELKENPKAIKIIFIIGIALVLIIFLTDFSSKKTPTVSNDTYTTDVQAYKNSLEKQLTSALKNISGIGNVKVMITLESTREVVYENEKEYESIKGENNENYSEKNSTVIIDSKDSDNGLVRKINEPQIRGVLVICDGGGNINIKTKVTEAVEKLFSISSARVCVTN